MEHLSNLTDPLTVFREADNHSVLEVDEVVNKMQIVIVPIIFIFGLLGNVLAIGCFFSQSLRATSCCLYLGAKCTSDTGFLAALFVMWLTRVHVGAVHVQGVCQLTVFLSYVCGFTSVWLVLAITYENYVRICRPHLSKVQCTRRVAVRVIGGIVGCAVLVYNFALWTNSVLDDEMGPPLCMAMIKFKDVIMVMTFFDTLTTLVLPTLIIIPLVLATLVAIARALERKSRLQDSLLVKRVTPRDFSHSLEAKVARFLLAVSLTFLLLHTPGHLIRLKLLVYEHILHRGMTSLDATLQRLFETLYYFNFCCSIVIFLASGANFRALFISMYCRRFAFLVPPGSAPGPSPPSPSAATSYLPPLPSSNGGGGQGPEGRGLQLKSMRGVSLESNCTCTLVENSGASRGSASNPE